MTAFSYRAGRKGINRVRAFYVPREQSYYAEWHETAIDQQTGETIKRRCSVKLSATTDGQAEDMADKMAADFLREERDRERRRAAPLTLDQLLASYITERTPKKGVSKQGHDVRAARIFRIFCESQPETWRRVKRHPDTLDRVDWERFIDARRAGRIEGFGPVRNRQIAMDLKFMIAVLNWGTSAKRDGDSAAMLRSNPWGTEIRRGQKWPMPVERNPHRPAMTDELRAGLIQHSPHVQFTAALILERETRHRNASIIRLTWSDVDVRGATVRWRGEADKAGRERVTPLTRAAVAALRMLPVGIGDVPVFRSERVGRTPRATMNLWLRQAKAAWLKSIGDQTERERIRNALRGIGFHAEKRAGVRDPKFRALDPKMQEELSGTNWETLRTVYDDVSLDEMRAAVDQLRSSAGSN